jgi:hypothetical protein
MKGSNTTALKHLEKLRLLPTINKDTPPHTHTDKEKNYKNKKITVINVNTTK